MANTTASAPKNKTNQTPASNPSPAKAPNGTFAHLHLHSEFSLLDGGNRVDRLINRVKELGMSAVALTDHGNLHGAVSFYNKAKDAGIKPIMGIEAYVAPDVNGKTSDRTNREYTGVSDGGFHLVLLAENQTGWQNLLKLSSDAYLNGFYFKPRMDKTTLTQWADGLIAINGHLGSSLAYHLTRYQQTNDIAHYKTALAEAKWHAEIFKPNENGEPRFYIELQRHETKEQDDINPHLVRLAGELNLPLVCDNDAHFLLADDWDAHDTLCCISMGKLKEEPNRLKYPRELYVKGPDQMAALFTDYPESVENTAKIAERCNVELDFSANHAPVVKIVPQKSSEVKEHPVGSTEWFKAFCTQYQLEPFDTTKDKLSPTKLKEQCDQALRELSEAGAVWRYGEDGITDAIRARLDRELTILADKSISAYFLIVWDFVNEARRRGIPSNARGSGVGTMVGYCLGLSNACPVQYGLLFERFTDPDRSEYPDIDIDICQDGRQEILEYVRDKYGYVAQIITFGTLKARAAIRDVGRVLNVSLSDVDKVCKLIGDGLGVTLDQALASEPDLKDLYNDNPLHRAMIDTARRLEGLSRHAGIHAAGVVIATQPLDNIVPLYRQGSDEQLPTVTQWDGPTCEKVGLLKMDFLGLRTLSIIERAKKLIRESLTPEQIAKTVRRKDVEENTDVLIDDPLDLDRLKFDDPRVFDLFARGDTAGVFQFESGGMRNLLMSMKPDRLEDLIAANALFRPGPMELIPNYCDRKHGREAVPTTHPIVEKFTNETYGIMVYQEQVMQIVHELGGIPLRQAYTLIKAISKKKMSVIDANRAQFIEGADKNGLGKKQADELFDLILKFAGYGFNKSHSTGYAIVAYQTAYLKTYFPCQYMAAVLTYESVSTEKVVQYIDECKRVQKPGGGRGVEVRPPEVNLSEVEFTVVYTEADPPQGQRTADDGHIRFGLSAVKGVGEKAIRAIITARQKDGVFKSLYDFCERVPSSAVNRSTIDALIKCGAYDSIHEIENRAALCEALESAMAAGSSVAADRMAGQFTMFESFAEAAPETPETKAQSTALPNVAPWSKRDLLQHEKDVLGFYVSSHPLHDHQHTIDTFGTVTIEQIKQLPADVEVLLGGMLTRVRKTVTRAKQEPMAMLSIEDASSAAGAGPMDAVVFPRTYAVVQPLLESDAIVILKGKIDRRREEPNLIVDEVIPIEMAAERLTRAVRIKLRPPGCPGSLRKQPYNGELNQLDVLLQQESRAANGTSAQVYMEVHEQGQVVNLRLDGLHIRVNGSLPQRIATILDEDETCVELIGPPNVKRDKNAVIETTGRAEFSSAMQGEESCASIDRY